MVVGGGPDGLECAIAAAERGHEVAIYDKREKLGSRVIAATKEIKGGTDLMRPSRFDSFGLLSAGPVTWGTVLHTSCSVGNVPLQRANETKGGPSRGTF
jgi:flavin-dependent dehydrogenase